MSIKLEKGNEYLLLKDSLPKGYFDNVYIVEIAKIDYDEAHSYYCTWNGGLQGASFKASQLGEIPDNDKRISIITKAKLIVGDTYLMGSGKFAQILCKNVIGDKPVLIQYICDDKLVLSSPGLLNNVDDAIYNMSRLRGDISQQPPMKLASLLEEESANILKRYNEQNNKTLTCAEIMS